MRAAAKWGILLGVTVCVWTLVLHFTGLYTVRIAAGQTADQAAVLLPIVAIALAMREERRRVGRGLRFREWMLVGIVVGVVSVPITAGFLWWYHHLLNPQWMEYIMTWKREQMVAAGAPPSDIESTMTMLRVSSTDGAQIVGALVGTILFSTVVSLIAGLFFRKPPRNVPSVGVA